MEVVVAGKQNMENIVMEKDNILPSLETRSKRNSSKTLTIVENTGDYICIPRIGKGGKSKFSCAIPEDLLPPAITDSKTRRYKINPEKALDKKLLASNRDKLYHVEKDGGGINITCQVGLFELLRKAACFYYSNFKTAGLTVEACVHRDSDTAVIQCTFKLKTYSGQVSYVVDLYHTSSKIRISGRHFAKFFESDWHRLGELIQDFCEYSSQDAHSINSSMRHCLEEAIGIIQLQKSKKPGAMKKVQGTQPVRSSNMIEAPPEVHGNESDPAIPHPQSDPAIPHTSTIQECSQPVQSASMLMLEALHSNETQPANQLDWIDGSRNADTPQEVSEDNLPTAQEVSVDNLPTAISPPRHIDSELIAPDIDNLFALLDMRRKEIDTREADIALRERKLTTLQRELEKRNKDVTSREIQNQALRSTLTHLERRVQELKEENNLLTATYHPQVNSRRPGTGCQGESECCNVNKPTCNSQPQIIIAPNFGNVHHPWDPYINHQTSRHWAPGWSNPYMPSPPYFHRPEASPIMTPPPPTPQWTTYGQVPGEPTTGSNMHPHMAHSGFYTGTPLQAHPLRPIPGTYNNHTGTPVPSALDNFHNQLPSYDLNNRSSNHHKGKARPATRMMDPPAPQAEWMRSNTSSQSPSNENGTTTNTNPRDDQER